MIRDNRRLLISDELVESVPFSTLATMSTHFKFDFETHEPYVLSKPYTSSDTIKLIQNQETGMWKLRLQSSATGVQPWYKMWYYHTSIGKPCKDGDTWTVQIDIAAPSDDDALYTNSMCTNWMPMGQLLRTTNLTGSVFVNAMRTGMTAVVASWVHTKWHISKDGTAESIAFVAAFLTYSFVSIILLTTISYGGSAISCDTAIVLDQHASRHFYEKYIGIIPSAQEYDRLPLISLELNNTLIAPKQNMYCVKQILCLTKGPVKVN